jgi:hypothetical protein
MCFWSMLVLSFSGYDRALIRRKTSVIITGGRWETLVDSRMKTKWTTSTIQRYSPIILLVLKT